jgi:methionyl-tRNA synthetase
MSSRSAPVYFTTPIYYVNDRPHIGHCFTTIVADVAARFERLIRGVPPPAQAGPAAASREVFLLTGTDEHADKVVTAAAQRGTTPQAWADRNAAEFVQAFAAMGVAHDDFIRTSEARHKERVPSYIKKLLARGDVHRGDYTGWYDASQEEYVTETAAKENDYKSSVTGKPLVRRTEPCYFFKLSKYAEPLAKHVERHPEFILPDARRSEVLGRIRLGLNDVPISRPVTPDPATQWGIRMPDDPAHRIYVWIDALFNYLTAVDTPARRALWPPPPVGAGADRRGAATGPKREEIQSTDGASAEAAGEPRIVHLVGKDILWFHAVIWPALLLSVGERLPTTIYAHGWWLAEGQKMSKSLGNFIDLELLAAYARRHSLDALRWYLITQGPVGANDASFAHSKFVEVFNADLANGIGNCTSRVANMIGKYFEGRVPLAAEALGDALPKGVAFEMRSALNASGSNPTSVVESVVNNVVARVRNLDWQGALRLGADLVRGVDVYINRTEPFRLAKLAAADAAKRRELGAILALCAELLRVAALLLSPVMPDKMAAVLQDWSSAPPPGIPLAELARVGGPHSLKEGTPIRKGEILFQRADPAEPPPRPA